VIDLRPCDRRRELVARANLFEPRATEYLKRVTRHDAYASKKASGGLRRSLSSGRVLRGPVGLILLRHTGLSPYPESV
jgi:hypothetical protein